LSILVDGVRVGEVDWAKGNRLVVGQSAEFIEVRARDDEGEVKVAAIVLSCTDRRAGPASEHTIVTDGGHKITLSVSFKEGPYVEAGDGVVELAHKEPKLVRSAWEGLRETVQTLREESSKYLFKDLSRNRTPLLGMRARGDQEVLRLADEKPMNYVELSEALIRGAVSAAVLKKVADRLVTLAEYAHAFRRMDDVEQISRLLIGLPLTWKYEAIGSYYLALATRKRGEGNVVRATRLLERVADTAQPIYRVRAVQSLGALAALEMKFDSCLKFFVEASRLATREGVIDPAVMVGSQQDLAAATVLAGDHHPALTVLLENVLPVARTLGGPQARANYSYTYCAYLNTFAVLLGKAGRLDEAEHICRTLFRSPLASAYPDFHATKKELELQRRDHATRSRVACGK
jgi:tetratricopeptide (TPR) repeat protein